MEKARTSAGRAPWLIISATALSFIADRLCKWWALGGATIGHTPAQFTLFLNRGIAFSLPLPDAIFWPAAAIALAVLGWSFIRALRSDHVAAALIVLIFAGALSNLIDRATHDATVDYLLLFDRSAVNIADGMIVGGLFALAMRSEQKNPPAESQG